MGTLGGLGISVSTATAAPIISSSVESVGTGARITASGLTVRATLAPAVADGKTADARAYAGGGGYYGVGGAGATALGGGRVTSSIGNNVRLPDGDVTVVATGTTRQKADATAIAIGFVGVGAAVSTATGQAATLAQLHSAADEGDRATLIKNAAEAAHQYFIQRELCGLFVHQSIIDDYDIPREVLAQMGAR